jgi:hypothetical protein
MEKRFCYGHLYFSFFLLAKDKLSDKTFARMSGSYSLSLLVQHSLLSFVCPKERSKEKGRQNELLRSFCHCSRTSSRTTGLIILDMKLLSFKNVRSCDSNN